MSITLRRLAILASFTALRASSLLAQRVHGEVLQSDGSTAAAGVVVVATGERGVPVTRVLSGANGSFEMRLPSAGRYSLSVLRIGFRPTVVDGVQVPDAGVVTVRIVLVGVAIPLAPVSVRGSDVCGASGDPQSQVVQVWTEAQTALAAAALWSREAMDAEWITFRRELSPGTEAVRAQEVRMTRNATTHAFQSWPADSLAMHGYVVTDGSGSTYYAPDPDVLLSESFAATHCFHLEPPARGSPGLVGVGFGPQRSRGDRIELEGTLWIDRASSELRWLDFRYVGLRGPADDASAGGRVEFLRLPDGPWMVSRWHIRMAQVGPPERAEKGYSVTTLKGSVTVLRAIGVSGGMVSRVQRRGQAPYVAAGSGLAVQLLRGDPAVSVALAEVQLAGTDYSWRSDSGGRVQAAPVLDGRYTARVATREMLAMGAPPVERDIEVSMTGARVDSVTVPTARDIVRGACGGDAVKDGRGALFGTVRDSSGRAAAGRAVAASWLGAVAGFGNGRLFAARTTIGTMTDDAGVWHLCDVPRDRAITVRATGDDGQAAQEVRLPDGRWFAEVPLRVSATMVAIAFDSTMASLEFLVRDAAGTGLDATTLELAASTGEKRTVTTDARGRALVAAFPPGLVKMRTRRAGYTAGEVVFSAVAGRNTVPVILRQAGLPVLDSVRVVGNRRTSSRLDGFETRRARRESTVSFTQEEIVKRAAGEISDLLRTVGSIRLVDSSGVLVPQLSRGFKLDRDANAQPCAMRVLLDGLLMPREMGVNVVRPSEVRGLEVFASTARTPTGLSIMATDVACGLIAIWTGRP